MMNQLRRKGLFIFSAALICMLIVVGAWFFTSPSFALVQSLQEPSKQAPFYAVIELAKPTYTALPEPTATILSTKDIEGSETDEVSLPIDTSIQADVEVVADTPVPDSPIIEAEEPPVLYTGNKYILIDISEQHMYVYEGENIVFSFVSSTGMYNATKVGSFSVLDKIPNAYGATWDIWMPNWLGIYWAGSTENGIHALPILPNGSQLWEGYLGTPISYGCIVLGAYESQLLYDWAEVGVPVEIQW